MPMASTPIEFAQALVERRSRITKALDDLFRRPARLRTNPHVGELRTPNYFRNRIPAWIKKELQARGVKKTREINHINDWPPAAKEELRKTFVHAIDHDVRIRFHWEIFGGATEETEILPKRLPRTGTITVTFRSPGARVWVSKAKETFGQIFVDVGKRRKKAATAKK